MNALFFLLGRIIFGGYFIFSGLHHFMEFGMMSEYAKAKGVLFPSGAVALTGLMILLAGLSILLGAYPIVGIVLLAAFLIPVSFMMHDFWTVQEPQMKMEEKINFTKNMALFGAVMMFLAIPRP